MAVEDVTLPPRRVELNPKTMNPNAEPVMGPEFWTKKAAEARAKREYEMEVSPPMAPEPPVKVTGEISMGKIDFQEDRRRAQEQADISRQRMEAQQEELRTQLQKTNAELNDTKMSLLTREMTAAFEKSMANVQAQIAQISRQPESGSDSALKALESAEAIASKLGMVRQPAGNGGGQDPRLQIELARLTLEEANRNRDFQLRLKQYDMEIARQSRLDQQAMDLKREELKQKAKRDEMIADLPRTLGAAFAQGMTDTGNMGGLKSFVNNVQPPVTAPVAAQAAPQAPAPPPVPTELPMGAPANAQAFIEAAMGESGSFECPDCHQPIIVRGDTTRAICGACGFQVPIKRKQPTVV